MPDGLDDEREFCLLTVSRVRSMDGREEAVVLSRDGATPETLLVIAPVVPLPTVAAVVMLL